MKKCNFCKKENNHLLIDEFLAQVRIIFTHDVSKNKLIPLLDVNNSFCRISFCPVCGRDLNKEEI